MKKCSKCKITKIKDNFSKKASSKDGLNGWCKSCNSESLKKWRLKNKAHTKNYDKVYNENNAELIKQRKKRYRHENPEKIKAYMKDYRAKNKVKIKQSKKLYRVKNIEKIKAYEKVKNKEYREKNPDKIKEYIENYRILNKDRISKNQQIRRKRFKQNNPNYKKQYYEANKEHICSLISFRYQNDIQFHLSKKLRTYFRRNLKSNATKGKIIDYLGMTIPEFKKYLESQFEDWMNWDNIGLYNRTFNYGWDIDHIKPLSLFDLTKEEEIKKAWHYTNLQPLCSKYNREIKRDNYNNQ